MTTRAARVADARAIAEIRILGWRSAYRGLVGDEHLDAMSVDSDTARWSTFLDAHDRFTRTVVVEDSEAVVGFASLSPYRIVDREAAYAVTALAVPGTVGELDAFYVHPDRWGTGIADELMVAALAALRSDGWTSARLWLLADNPRALQFYRRHGWAPDGGRETLSLPGRPDEIRMTRELA